MGNKGTCSGFELALGNSVNYLIFINVHLGGDFVAGVMHMFDRDVTGVGSR